MSKLSDAGKSIEIPGAGASSVAPAPNATLLATIQSVDSDGKGVIISTPAINTANNVKVTWGTDNSPKLQAAANACPAASNAATISPFTSKGCVVLIPNPGGTGDHMFGSTVTRTEALNTGDSVRSVNPNGTAYVKVTPMAGNTFSAGQTVRIGVTDSSASTMGASDNPAGNYAAFRASSTVPDTKFACVLKDGTTQNVQTSDTTVDTNVHVFEIVENSATEAWTFKIDGNVQTNRNGITTNAPGSANLRYVDVADDTTAAARNMKIAYIFLASDK